MTEIVLEVTKDADRLDRYLAARCPELSRSQLARLVKDGQVLVNGAPAKASYTPTVGDHIQVRLPEPNDPLPRAEPIPLDIIYEDESLLVLNKPAGLVVHPGAGQPDHTLVNALLAHRPDLADAGLDPLRPGIVHRLDRDTSGLMLVAATSPVLLALQRQFQSRDVVKIYLALAHGRLLPLDGAIEAPLGRDERRRERMAVVEQGGRFARTEYHVREHLSGVTFLEARLLTGRTHQIRVHLASIGHPVVGDQVYGPRRAAITAPRQMLHAWRLGFTHPLRQEQMTFTADLPDDMQGLLEQLRAAQ